MLGENENGQLGYGHTDPVATTLDSVSILDQGPVTLGASAVAVYTGGSVSCALLDEGSIKCWGQAAGGATGYGKTENLGDDEVPGSYGVVPVGLKVKKIAKGKQAASALITEQDTLRCWGNNNYGQLGYGHTEPIGDDETPAEVGDVEVI